MAADNLESEITKIIIVYHLQTGNTQKMAEDTTLEALLTADTMAICTPENFGYMSGMMNDYFDRTYYAAQDIVFRKPYVAFISAGKDSTGAQRAIERIALGYKFKTFSLL